MVNVRLEPYGWLKEAAGDSLLEMEVSQSAPEAICEIVREITNRKLSPIENGDFTFLINGRNPENHLKGGLSLKNGDTIAVIPIVGGG